jgi:hypothetical protein
MLPGGSYLAAEEVAPVRRPPGHRLRVVLRGAVAAMALVAVAAALSRQRPTALQQTEPSAHPNITKTPGPSERQWMAWEDAHGMPKECTPVKEVSVGPHGEEVFTYYADCSMYAKEAAQLKARKAALKSKQGATTLAGKHTAPVTLAGKSTGQAFHKVVAKEASKLIAHYQARANALIVDPESKKTEAKKALAEKMQKAKSVSHDLEPPALPSLLKPKAAKAKPPTPVQVKAAGNSKAPATPDHMWQPPKFQKRVVKEAAQFWQRDEARADALIVDPDANVANGGGAKLAAKPVPKLARLAAKASGPAAAILEMVSGSRSLE